MRRDEDIITAANIYGGVLIAIAVIMSLLVVLYIEGPAIHSKMEKNIDCYKVCHEERTIEQEKASWTDMWRVIWEYEMCCQACEREE